MIQDFESGDREYITRMLGTGEVPADVYAEYIEMRRMGAVCHRRDEPLGFAECRSMLRRLGYHLPNHLAHDVNWRTLPFGTKVIVQKPNKPTWLGFYNGTIDVGTVGVKPELEQPETIEVERKFCRIWQGESIEDESTVSIVPTDDELATWQTVVVDTPVKVTRTNGEVTEGLFRAVLGKRLQIQVGDKLFNYAPRSVEVAELAEV